MWAFFLDLCFSAADWLSGQTLITWITFLLTFCSSTASQVRVFVQEVLSEVIRESSYHGKVTNHVCVACPSCLRAKRKCKRHHVEACTDDDCVHLLPVSPGQQPVCPEWGDGRSRPEVEGLDKWFPVEVI